MSIAILYDRAKTDELGIKLTAKQAGINLDHIPFYKVSFSFDNNSYKLKSIGKDFSNKLDENYVVLNRTQSRNRRLFATKILEESGKKVICPSNVESICFSKLKTLLHFKNLNVNIPKSVYIPCNPQESTINGNKVSNEEDIANLIQQDLGSEEVVIKPDAGTHGRGVQLAHNKGELVSILKTLKPSITNPAGVLAQEYIQKWFYDLRIIVYKEAGMPPYCHSTALARAGFGDFRTNTSLGNMAFGIKLPEMIQNRAIKCTENLGTKQDAWVLALDAMINVGEDKFIDDDYIKTEFNELETYFNKINQVKREKNLKTDFKNWNERLESAFQMYMESDPYENITQIIETSVIQKKDSVLFHEINSSPDFWEQTRLIADINLAEHLLNCAKSLLLA